jgi:hypothetical protein
MNCLIILTVGPLVLVNTNPLAFIISFLLPSVNYADALVFGDRGIEMAIGFFGLG